jgi:hypothetical protein
MSKNKKSTWTHPDFARNTDLPDHQVLRTVRLLLRSSEEALQYQAPYSVPDQAGSDRYRDVREERREEARSVNQ